MRQASSRLPDPLNPGARTLQRCTAALSQQDCLPGNCHSMVDACRQVADWFHTSLTCLKPLASHAAGFTCPWLHIQCVAQVDIMESEPNQTVRVKGALCAVRCLCHAVYASLALWRWRGTLGLRLCPAEILRLCLRPLAVPVPRRMCRVASWRRACCCAVLAGPAPPAIHQHDAYPVLHHNAFPTPLPQTSSPTPRARLCSPCRRVPRHSCWRCSWLAWTHERAWRPLGWQVSCRVAHERIRLASTPPMH